MKIAMIIAFSVFRDEEYLEPKQIFSDYDYQITTFSTSLGTAEGKLGARVDVDDTIDHLNVDDFDAVIFVGGGGAQCYIDDPVAHEIARKAAEKKVIAAICMAPAILAHAGVTKGRLSTVFPDRIEEIKALGVKYINKEVVVDGNIITARDYKASSTFADELIDLLEK